MSTSGFPQVGTSGGPVAGFPQVGTSGSDELDDFDLGHPVLDEIARRIADIEPDYPMPAVTRPGEAEVKFNADNHYMLPALDNMGGSLQSFERASSIAKSIEESTQLHRWQMHKLVEGLARYPELLTAVDPVAAARRNYQAKSLLDSVMELAHWGTGTERASKFGSAVHAWIEAHDSGLVAFEDVDIVCRAHVAAFLQAREDAGLESVPEYIERVVHNPLTGAAGRFDQIVRNRATGELEVLDVKTSRSTDFSGIGFCVQLGQYATADKMLRRDGTKWDPMPQVSVKRAWVAHVPSTGDTTSPGRAIARIVPVNLATTIPAQLGAKAAQNPVTLVGLSALVRAVQAASKKIIGEPAAVAYAPFPDTRDLILDKLSKATTSQEMSRVYLDYRHHWEDEFTAYGQQRLTELAAR